MVILFLLMVIVGVQPVYAEQWLSLVSLNANRLFDTKDDGNKAQLLTQKAYENRINSLINKIVNGFTSPDVLALQEIENIEILHDLVHRLKSYGLSYQAVLQEGNDVSGIDVGYLVNTRYRVKKQQQLFASNRISHTEGFLFARPPLLIEVCQTECVTIINLHLRSMRQLSNKKAGQRVALKRKHQAEALAKWINRFQIENPSRRIILIGDFNALAHADKFVDVVGIIRGQPDQTTPKWKSEDYIQRDLIDLTQSIPKKSRYSYIYKTHKQQLDYLLIGDTANYRLESINFESIDFKVSDHAALKARIKLLP